MDQVLDEDELALLLICVRMPSRFTVVVMPDMMAMDSGNIFERGSARQRGTACINALND